MLRRLGAGPLLWSPCRRPARRRVWPQWRCPCSQGDTAQGARQPPRPVLVGGDGRASEGRSHREAVSSWLGIWLMRFCYVLARGPASPPWVRMASRPAPELRPVVWQRRPLGRIEAPSHVCDSAHPSSQAPGGWVSACSVPSGLLLTGSSMPSSPVGGGAPWRSLGVSDMTWLTLHGGC